MKSKGPGYIYLNDEAWEKLDEQEQVRYFNQTVYLRNRYMHELSDLQENLEGEDLHPKKRVQTEQALAQMKAKYFAIDKELKNFFDAQSKEGKQTYRYWLGMLWKANHKTETKRGLTEKEVSSVDDNPHDYTPYDWVKSERLIEAINKIKELEKEVKSLKSSLDEAKEAIH